MQQNHKSQQNNKSQKRKGGWPWSEVDPNAPVETNKGFFSSLFLKPVQAEVKTVAPVVAPAVASAEVQSVPSATTRLLNNGGKKRRNKSNKRSKKSKRNQSRKR